MKIIFLSLFLICSQGCGEYLVSSDSHQLKEDQFKGYYIVGHEVNSFQPCQQKKVYWVTASEKDLVFLKNAYMQYASESYDRVLLEIEGRYLQKADDGFAMDYDGVIFITKFIQMKSKLGAVCD